MIIRWVKLNGKYKVNQWYNFFTFIYRNIITLELKKAIKNKQLAITFFCVGFFFLWSYWDIFGALTSADKFKYIKFVAPIIVAMVAIVLTHHFAVKRESQKLKIEKIEALYTTSIEYCAAANQLLKGHEYLNVKKNVVVLANGYGQYPDTRLDLMPFELAVNKLEMLFGLHFPDEGLYFAGFELKTLYEIDITDKQIDSLREIVKENKGKLIRICHKLMSEL